MEKVSSFLKEYKEIKKMHPDSIILLRCGDFYETYGQDAVDASSILGITLTYRNNSKEKMAGFPHHALDTYLPKLVRAGRKVAICEQLTPPKPKKKSSICSL